MWQPVTLPYRSENAPLLPTANEIRRCRQVLGERSAVKIVAVSEQVVVKFGGALDVSEGQALIYLEQHVPDVPAPRLHAMYYDCMQLFLVMERVPGVRLDTIWTSLTDIEKESITARLCRIFNSMKRAECPSPNFYGGLDGGSLRHYLFHKYASYEHLGPFYSEADLIASLVGNFRLRVEYHDRPDYKARFYEKHLSSVLRNHRPTLTHGDVQRQNSMVAKIPSDMNETGEQSFQITLLDWKRAGWYPDYWELFCTSSLFDMVYWEEDWCWLVERFLQVHPAEVVMMMMFDKDMR